MLCKTVKLSGEDTNQGVIVDEAGMFGNKLQIDKTVPYLDVVKTRKLFKIE